LVKAMVDLAHEFGLEVVAEGVEDVEVTDRLRELGCDIGQGFLWSRPVTSEALPDVLFQLSFRRRTPAGTASNGAGKSASRKPAATVTGIRGSTA
jgi:sensor c-di-GMP phosphodiesterase-like protein